MTDDKTNYHNQKINCTVGSCIYNNDDTNLCELKQIEVSPCCDCSTGKPEDESMCGSYKGKCK